MKKIYFRVTLVKIMPSARACATGKMPAGEGGGVVVGTIRDLDEHSALASGAVPGALKGYKGSYTYIHIPVELYGGRMGTHHLCSSQCP